jgi:hypothetical protein
MRAVRLRRAAFALVPLLAATSLAMTAPARADGPTGSAVTRSGTGPFAGLDVTVAQTRNLINQAVLVTWRGGAPTQPSTSWFGINYLQIMQCWGDESGPDREQCQYGARVGDGRGGLQGASRQVNYGDTLVDPLETYRQPPGSFENVFVPFRAADGGVAPGAPNEYFDSVTTNEVPFARTLADGTGEEVFEVQTIQEAPGLRCGAIDNGKVRDCWLVVVPRNNREVNGGIRTDSLANRLESSPLSASNWQHRISFRLEFEPVEPACDFAQERRVEGQEQVLEAVLRWQPAICAERDLTIGFSQVPDYRARQGLAGDDPGMSLISQALPAADVPADRRIVYAPVAVSGVGIGFLIERVPDFEAPPEVVAREGSRISQLRLTPRLVAKLLTASYGYGSPRGNPALASNPATLADDPEFVALNPEFADLYYLTLSDLIVPLGRSDAAQTLWRYVLADPQARAFLAGKPDEDGMVVNPAFKGTAQPPDDFPKSDQYCQTFVDERQPLCALDWRPYSGDFHEAALSAARGDNLARASWDVGGNPPTWRRTGPMAGGSRAVMGVADTATLRRYGLAVASLRNAAGQFAAPDAAGMAAAVAPLVADPKQAAAAWQPDPGAVKAGYPLTVVTYAATAPAVLDKRAGAEYAEFLRFAAGPGQTPGVGPGTLPSGYLPLPVALRTVAEAAATEIAETAGTPIETSIPVAASEPGTTETGFSGGTVETAGSASADDIPAASGVQPEVAPAPQSIATIPLSATPLDPAAPSRFLLAGLLGLGLIAAVAGPVLIRFGGQRGG